MSFVGPETQTMVESTPEMWPVLARWRQQSDGGTITWHLAGLRSDRGYWGYVHFRTQSRQENRNFEGTLDEIDFEQVASLVQEIERHATNHTEPKPLDGLIGIGKRSSFRRIFGIRGGMAEPDNPSATRAYGELIELIQPIIAANIIE